MSGDSITLEGFGWQIGVHPEVLKDLCDRVSQAYKTRVKPKLGGGKRRIDRCFGLLRVVHRRILDTYLRGITWPDYVYGIGEEKGPIENARAHQGKHQHFLTDIRNFYPSTQSSRVRRLFAREFHFTPSAASVATRLVTLDGGLPQGIHPSTHLAYLAFQEIDRRLRNFADECGLTYTRYGDDLSFSAPSSFKSKTQKIKYIVNSSDNRYSINDRKTFYKQGPVEITGVRVLNNKIVVPDRFEERLEKLCPSSAEWKGLRQYADRVESFFEGSPAFQSGTYKTREV
jgi:RNA-directed DNA polymerase